MTFDSSALAWGKNDNGLLPAVIQDVNTGQVLMLGYMNAQALQQTQSTGFVTFFSRSKKRIWKKGETSGNTLRFISVSCDCDGDSLLIRAIPMGPTCHSGKQSCFNTAETALETLGNLIETIRRRAKSGSQNSYTKRLLDGGINVYGAKVLEEAEELVRAAGQEGRQRTIEEASDLLYHTLVLFQGEKISIENIAQELRRRRR